MTDITELTQEAARKSGSILIIVAARMARREFFTPLHALCEAGKRVVSTRALHDAVERAEECMVSQVPKIVDGHDRLTKKLKEAESRNAELVEALEKAQQRITQMESRTVTVKLASRRLPSDYVDGEFGNDDLAAIHNACRLECRVSVEKYLSAHGIVVKWEDE
ncbi:hypothetical protein [Klebsiella pneumoniae]|uniref:hypothetical protein n=1 Tax=Klebsiella pneumoniae TaxID=573 RepID=UPI00249076C6|nr:hypothetical protein [Klebsiella pneumoniae]